jgi:deoxyribodipyrimidine photolyase-related protein
VTTTALVLGDQLMRDNPALDGADRVLLVQSRTLLRRAGLHRRRAHLVLSGCATWPPSSGSRAAT